jgi:hypothetical protein
MKQLCIVQKSEFYCLDDIPWYVSQFHFLRWKVSLR